MNEKIGPSGFTLDQMAELVSKLFRNEPDNHVISIGDWMNDFDGSPLFTPVVRFTVGDFRKWSDQYPSANQE